MRWIAAIVLAAVACGTPSLSAGAQPQPAANVPPGGVAAPSHVEHTEQTGDDASSSGVVLRRTSPTTDAGAAPGNITSAAPELDVARIALALAIVLGLIFTLRWIVRRIMGGSAAGRSSRAVQVLSRTMLAPRQQVLLLQVGRRVVVVGDSGQQMTTLCEITDPDEIASLVAQTNGQANDGLTKAFSSLVGRAGAQFREQDEAEASDDADGAQAAPADPTVNMTREELSGLLDKVRLVSRQTGRSG